MTYYSDQKYRHAIEYHVGNNEEKEFISKDNSKEVLFQGKEDVDLFKHLICTLQVTEGNKDYFISNNIGEEREILGEGGEILGEVYEVQFTATLTIEIETVSDVIGDNPEPEEPPVEEEEDWTVLYSGNCDFNLDCPTTEEVILFDFNLENYNEYLDDERTYRATIDINEDIDILQSKVVVKGSEFTITKNNSGSFIIKDQNNRIRCELTKNTNDKILTSSDFIPQIRNINLYDTSIDPGSTHETTYYLSENQLLLGDRVEILGNDIIPNGISLEIEEKSTGNLIYIQSSKVNTDPFIKSDLNSGTDIIMRLKNDDTVSHNSGARMEFYLYSGEQT